MKTQNQKCIRAQEHEMRGMTREETLLLNTAWDIRQTEFTVIVRQQVANYMGVARYSARASSTQALKSWLNPANPFLESSARPTYLARKPSPMRNERRPVNVSSWTNLVRLCPCSEAGISSNRNTCSPVKIPGTEPTQLNMDCVFDETTGENFIFP